MLVWTTDARTTQPVKQVLQTEDTAVYVLRDSKEKIAKKVSGDRDIGLFFLLVIFESILHRQLYCIGV